MQKEEDVTYSDVLYQHFPVGTKQMTEIGIESFKIRKPTAENDVWLSSKNDRKKHMFSDLW